MKNIVLLLLGVIFNYVCFSQANFIAPDTVCVNQNVVIQNFSTGLGLDYSWNFCRPSVNNFGVGVNTGNPTGLLNANVFCDIVEDGGNYYMFVTNYNLRNVIRYDFGTSPTNVPLGVNLGNFGGIIPPQTEGIQIRKDGTNWYGFVVGGNGSANARIVRLDFGASLTNTPIATNLGNIGNMNWSTEYQLLKDGNNWYGLVINRSNSRVSIHDFGNSLANVPVGSSYQITSANGTCNLMAVKDAGNWYVFVTAMFGGQSLIRLDYGNNLTNVPTETNLGNFGGNITSLPRGIIILKDCDEYVGYLGHEGGRTLKLNFPTGLTGIPTVTNLNNISGVYGKVHNFTPITHNGNLYLFTCDYQSNTITRLDISLCASTIPSSDLITPPSITYPTAGNYDITLLLDVGRGTQDAYCKDIDVLNSVPFDLGPDTNVCSNIGAISLDAGSGYINYLWSTGATSQQITVTNPGKYFVDALDTASGCPIVDTINIDFQYVNVDLGNDSSMCDGIQKIQLDGGVATNYLWSTGDSTQTILANNSGLYWVEHTDPDNCKGRDTVYINYNPLPVINLPEDTIVQCGLEFVLNQNGNQNYFYRWQDGTNTPQLVANRPGRYTVLVTNQYNCANSFSANVNFKDCEIFYPNAFTPGLKDDLNAEIRPKYFVKPILFNLVIFNKWGEQIYETDDIDASWNGTYKNDNVKADVYVYKMTYKFEGETRKKEKIGHISLLP